MSIEYRTVPAGGAVDSNGQLTGMVTPFNTETVIGDLTRGGFREEIAPGTFTKTLQERSVVLIHNHDTAMPMASTAIPEGEEGHLSLTQENDSFRAAAIPFDTTYANDVRKVSKVLGMSFGFEVTKDSWYDAEGRDSNPQVGVKRVIREVKLHEVSTTAFPAYVTTMGSVSARDSFGATADILESRAGNPKPYGDVAYADPKNGKYPIDTKEHVKAAWSYINMPKNAAKYPLNGVTLESVKARIRAAAKKFGIEISADESKSAPEVSISGTDYTDMASRLITMFNDLPADERARVLAEISEPTNVTRDGEPDTSTHDVDSMRMRLKIREAELAMEIA